MKHLIVNADDFGLSSDINRGIVYCFQNGIVTNASLIVNEAASKEAIAMAKDAGPPFGLHLNLFSGTLGEPQKLFGPAGKIREVLRAREERNDSKRSLSKEECSIVRGEFTRQLVLFRKLVGQNPNHLSYHFGLHFIPELLDVFIRFAERERFPFRFKRVHDLTSPAVLEFRCPERWIDLFHGTRITSRDFEQLLEDLPDGITEISAHPGYRTAVLNDAYNIEREYELLVLCSPEIRTALERHQILLSDYSACSLY